MPEAKAKAERRRQQAVKDFKDWKRQHPRARLERQVVVFDMLVDGVALPPAKKRKKNATAF